MSEHISVIIPSFNERTRLPPTLAEIETFCMRHEEVNEVIVVDDASTDQTVERAMYYHSRIPGFRVVRHDENQGKWAAIRTGIRAASNDAVLLMDADGSASIWELEKMKQQTKVHSKEHDREFDMDMLDFVITHKIPVFGTRFHKGSDVKGKSMMRTIVSRVYVMYVRAWYWLATGRRDVQDMQCPFKIVHVSNLQGLPTQNQYAGDIDLACRIPAKIWNVPVEFIHKDGSKVKMANVLRMAINTMKVAFEYRKEHKGEGSQVHTDVHKDVLEDNNV